jgi:chemosensory pili system protein ChpA (sensor histidine kinase/response regulator)
VLTAVAGEIHVNLNKIETALESYADTQRSESLESVPQDLKQVHGVLQILGQHRVAELLGMADECVRNLIAGALAPDRALIDALAVAVGTAQAYIQRMEHGRPKLTDTLDRAIRDLEDAVTIRDLDGVDAHALVGEIRDGLDHWFNDNADYQSLGKLRRSLRRTVYFADQHNHASLYQISSELSNLMDIVTDEPALLTEEVRDTFTRSLDKLAVLAGELPAAVPVQPLPPAVEQSPIQDTELQADILEIYFEEAGECFQVIDETLPAWRRDTGNEKALTDLRRQFHTLKGSGRMAGVGKPAELAWLVEDLLNHVIAGKLEISESVFEFIETAINVLKPVLENELQGAGQIDLDKWNAHVQRVFNREDQAEAVKEIQIKTNPQDIPLRRRR